MGLRTMAFKKMYLAEAELAWAKGDRISAYPKYKSAIALFKEGGFYMHTALAYERTGKFFLEGADSKEAAAPYFEEAPKRQERSLES